MSPSPQLRAPASGGINAHDILYVLFKHKWKIIILSLLGFVVAGGMAYRYSRNPSFETKAKLLVRYVVERTTSDPDAPSKTSGGNGISVMNTELEILKSDSVALDAATELGPEKVMPKGTEKPTNNDAAFYISQHLTVDSQLGTDVINLSYRDTDPQRAVRVLTQVVKSYLKRHLEIHRSPTAVDELENATLLAKSELSTAESSLDALKKKWNVLSIDEKIAVFEAQRQLVATNKLNAESAIAEQQAKVAAMEKIYPTAPKNRKTEEKGTGDPVPEKPATVEGQANRRKTAVALAEFKDLTSRLNLLRDERNKTLLRRSPTDPMISSLDRQIAEVQSKKLDLEVKNPGFAREAAATATGQTTGIVRTLDDERALLSAMQARLGEIEKQSESLDKEIKGSEGVTGLPQQISEFKVSERERKMAEEKYRALQSRLEMAKLDENLGKDPSKMGGIGTIQPPSAPVRSIGGKTMKTIVGIAASGVALGLALAFFTELVVDRRISRPADIKKRLKLPLMLSIPYIRSKDGIAQLIGSKDPLEPPPIPGSKLAIPYTNGNHISTEPAHFIAPYAAAIHDRILFNFEINNITHKPKLVALTGLSEGAGTTTIATGIAKAFSEGGNRKVLLVDLNPPRMPPSESATESLRRALEASRSDQFRNTPQNLYFASAATRRFQGDTTALAPIGLREILPYLVASDFDYIVFDMPPVDPTSPTMAMAGFMDKVLLVLDAANTTPDTLKWAYSELEKGRADVSCIFNKARSLAPRWVEGGF